MPTPHSLGFSFPPEWHPQSATWFSWPRPEGISFPERYHTIPANIAAIIRQITPRQLVRINVPNENYRRIVSEQLIAGGVPKAHVKNRVKFHLIKTNEAWCRDHGPAFVLRRGKRAGKATTQAAIVDWGFNAWGGKYPPWDDDDRVPTLAAKDLGIKRVFYPTFKGQPIVMEGGAVEFNGDGCVLTTEACLLHKNRNPHMTRGDIEQALCDWYGQEKVLWLHDGIAGDDTDGHIDDLARFLNPTTIAIALEADSRDANYKVLKDNARRTTFLRDAHGQPFNIVTLPMPKAVVHDGQRLPATYLNFLFINGALLVPTFRDKKNDRLALSVLQAMLPEHEVIGVDCVELVWGLGTIHCLTQQVPKW